MMQPVIPDYTIQKRSMSSYFKKNTQPAYIMLEWILDNPSKKDYLLTGIAMTQKNTGEENGNEISRERLNENFFPTLFCVFWYFSTLG